MHINTYKLYKIITYPTFKLVGLIERWHDFLWTYAHYKWGAFKEMQKLINSKPRG